jgi:hypothetical protein
VGGPQHKEDKMFDVTKIPPAILPFIKDPPLLKGESRQEYYDLLGVLISETAPVDMVEWLWLIQFTDCAWEIIRNRRIRAFLIDLQRTKDLNAIRSVHYDDGEKYLANWKPDPDFLMRYGTDVRSMVATAFVKVAPKLELIDKNLERLQRRSDEIIEKLECRREVFAHRARRAAANVINAQYEEPRRIAGTSIVIEPMNEVNEQQIVDADSASIIPSLAEEPNAPDSDGSLLNPSPTTSPDETQG